MAEIHFLSVSSTIQSDLRTRTLAFGFWFVSLGFAFQLDSTVFRPELGILRWSCPLTLENTVSA